MKPLTYAIHEFKSKRFIGTVSSYEQGMDRCMELYRCTRVSHFVRAVAA